MTGTCVVCGRTTPQGGRWCVRCAHPPCYACGRPLATHASQRTPEMSEPLCLACRRERRPRSVCELCRKVFIRPQYNRPQRYCSRECSVVARFGPGPYGPSHKRKINTDVLYVGRADTPLGGAGPASQD